MNGESISRALNGLPEEMIEEAMLPARKRHPLWFRAACAAVLALALLTGAFGLLGQGEEYVTAPGILAITVQAKDADGFVTTVLEEGISVPTRDLSLAMGSMPGLPVVLSLASEDFPEEDVSFEVSVDPGMYVTFDDNNHLQMLPVPFTCKNNTHIYWNLFSGITGDSAKNCDHIYTNITIYYKEHIVGYAVLRFDQLYDNTGKAKSRYSAALVESVTFPKIDGEFQDVSKKDVDQRFRALQLS